MGLWLRNMAYAAIPDHRPDLKPSAAVLLLFIADRCADRPGELWAKLETIAEWTGSSRSQVSRDLKNLQELDLIAPKIQIHRRPTHWYVFPNQYPEAVAQLFETTTETTEKEKVQKVLRALCAHRARHVSARVRALCGTEQEDEQNEEPSTYVAPVGAECNHPTKLVIGNVEVCVRCRAGFEVAS